jgi:hypothetical protein
MSHMTWLDPKTSLLNKIKINKTKWSKLFMSLQQQQTKNVNFHLCCQDLKCYNQHQSYFRIFRFLVLEPHFTYCVPSMISWLSCFLNNYFDLQAIFTHFFLDLKVLMFENNLKQKLIDSYRSWDLTNRNMHRTVDRNREIFHLILPR